MNVVGCLGDMNDKVGMYKIILREFFRLHSSSTPFLASMFDKISSLNLFFSSPLLSWKSICTMCLLCRGFPSYLSWMHVPKAIMGGRWKLPTPWAIATILSGPRCIPWRSLVPNSLGSVFGHVLSFIIWVLMWSWNYRDVLPSVWSLVSVSLRMSLLFVFLRSETTNTGGTQLHFCDSHNYQMSFYPCCPSKGYGFPVNYCV